MPGLVAPPQPVRSSPSQQPPTAVLEDRLPDWLRAPRRLAGWTLVVATAVVVTAHLVPGASTVWTDLALGRFVLERGFVPRYEPFLTLAEGMPFVASSWLWDVAAFVSVKMGIAGLSFLHAATLAAAMVLLIASFNRQGIGTAGTGVGLAVFAALAYPRILTIGPAPLGVALFIALWSWSAGRGHSLRTSCLFVAGLFAVWVNVHISFVAGLAYLAFLAVGRAADLVRRTGRVRSMLASDRLRREMVVLHCAALATLANPYGFGVYVHISKMLTDARLQSLPELAPLHLRSAGGWVAAAAVIALVGVLRCRRGRLSARRTLPLVVFGLAGFWASGFLAFWAPLVAGTLSRPFCTRRRSRDRDGSGSADSHRAGKWTMVTAGLIWIAFALTPLGARLLHGAADDDARLAARLPLRAVGYLRRQEWSGLVLNPPNWGDWLTWSERGRLEPFATGRLDRLPNDVWRDYTQIVSTTAGWDERLERYGVRIVLADPVNQPGLVAALKRHADWRFAYEDDQSAVFLREESARTDADRSADEETTGDSRTTRNSNPRKDNSAGSSAERGS